MNGRAVAWFAYVPIPGLWLVPLWGARGDRFARFHAIQGGLLVASLYLLLLLCGFYSYARGPGAMDASILSALVFLSFLGYLVVGLVAAGRGRYLRLRPAWDAATRWL